MLIFKSYKSWFRQLYGSLSQKAFRGELGLKDDSLLSSAEPSLSQVEASRSMAAEPNADYKTIV